MAAFGGAAAAQEEQSLTAYLPGDGEDGRCDGRRATSFEHRVLNSQLFRLGFGMPTDRAYVISVLRDPQSPAPAVTPAIPRGCL